MSKMLRLFPLLLVLLVRVALSVHVAGHTYGELHDDCVYCEIQAEQSVSVKALPLASTLFEVVESVFISNEVPRTNRSIRLQNGVCRQFRARPPPVV